MPSGVTPGAYGYLLDAIDGENHSYYTVVIRNKPVFLEVLPVSNKFLTTHLQPGPIRTPRIQDALRVLRMRYRRLTSDIVLRNRGSKLYTTATPRVNTETSRTPIGSVTQLRQTVTSATRNQDSFVPRGQQQHTGPPVSASASRHSQHLPARWRPLQPSFGPHHDALSVHRNRINHSNASQSSATNR